MLGPSDLDGTLPPGMPEMLRRRSSASVLEGTDPNPQQAADACLPPLGYDKYLSLQNVLLGIVQVFVNQVVPNTAQPWTKQSPRFMTGTGFVIDLRNRMLLTNAHCVEFARTILIRKTGDAQKYEASLLSISHQCDIAILTVHDPVFWEHAVELDLGDLPHMQQKIDVIGYPIGGDTVSITSGVVSRIDWHPYSHSGGEKYLCVQVDASINPGNSGGPALSDGKLVGVAFQGMRSANNIGYIIPITIVKSLLDNFKMCAKASGFNLLTDASGDLVMSWPTTRTTDAALVKLRPFARFCAVCQSAENPYIRLSVSLPATESGIIFRSVEGKLSNLQHVFQNNDVLVAIDGIRIENDGRIVAPPLQPISFQHIITSKLVGEPVTYTFYRNGVKNAVTVDAENPPRLVPLIWKEPHIPFVMFAGLVFVPVFNEGISDVTDFYTARMTKHNRRYLYETDQCVVLSAVLPHKIGIGYDDTGMFQPIYKVNGVEVRNLTELAVEVSKASGDMISFEFMNDECIVFPLGAGIDATFEIQVDFGMSALLSADISSALKEQGLTYPTTAPSTENSAVAISSELNK